MTKKQLLVLLCPLLLISCHRGYDDGNEQIKLSEDNYIYEGDLHVFYLERRIDTVQVTIDSLQAVIDNQQGDDKTVMELAAARAQKDSFTEEIASIPEQSLLPKIKPRPKGPCDPIGTCFPLTLNLKYLILEEQNDLRSVLILNAQDQPISTTTTGPAPLMGYGDALTYQVMTAPQGQPDELVKIKVLNLSKGLEYELTGFLFNL